MIKKILKYLVVLIIILAAGLGAYWYFDRQQGGSGVPLSNNNGFSIRDLFPFGTGGNTPSTPNTTPTPGNPNGIGDGNQTPTTPPRLWQISSEPQSGFLTFNSSTTPKVRFVDRATGNIFESSLRQTGLNRISNTTIPKVYEAIWQPNASAVVLQYLNEDNETIVSTYGKIIPSNNSSSTQNLAEIQATFLPNNISSLSINQQLGLLSFIVDDQEGSEIFVTNTNAASPRLIFKSPIKDFSIAWVGNTTLGLLSKPSSESSGQFYFLKTDSGKLERMMGDKKGLSALASQDGTRIMYSETTGNFFSSGLFNPKTGEFSKIPFNTLADKCVWSKKTPFLYCATPKAIPTGKYPDHWYQGRVTFEDTFWRINTSTGATNFLIDPKVSNGTEFDAINLNLSPNEDYLVFTNKKDSMLWGLKIETAS